MDILIIFAATYLVFGIVAIAAIFWLLAPKEQKIFVLVNGAIAAIIGFLVVKVLRHTIESPRPFVVNNTTPLVPHDATNGLPSEHTTYSMIIALLIAQVSKRWGILLIALALIVGAGRVGAQVHSPLDVAAGIVVAVAAVSIARLATNLFLKKAQPWRAESSAPKPEEKA